MSLTPINLEIDQSDDELINVHVKDKDGADADLTGCELKFAIGTSPTQVPLITKAGTPTDSSGGIRVISPATEGNAQITIDSADTSGLASAYLGRQLKWELDVTDSLNNEITLARGTIVINRDMVP